MNPLIQLKTTPPLLITLAFLCSTLLPKAQAVSPPPSGGYPNFTTAAGDSVLSSLTSGLGNTGVGWFALGFDQIGSLNTAVGVGALYLNTADSNTAVGAAALLLNTTGTLNTATGVDALVNNDSGSYNTANGAFALFFNTIGEHNTAIGREALLSNINGAANTAVGDDALFTNTDGSSNTANGGGALFSNTSGSNNTAVGGNVLVNNTIGADNTAVGWSALLANINGANNTAIGSGALQKQTVSAFNTAVGFLAGSSVIDASNVTCIGGNVGGANVSNTTWIGNIYGVTTQSGTTAAVIVSDSGQLGTVVSSERFKKDISTMEKASEAILSLRPVTFHYKSDTKGVPQYGLIAEEVAKVNPALVLPDKEGKPYTVRYDAVNAMLLNEFLKEHRTVQELKKEVAALSAGLQKVSAQLEASKPAPQVVNNP